MIARAWRRRALFGALAVTIVLSAVSGGKGGDAADKPAAAARTRTPQHAREAAQPITHVELERLQRPEAPADRDIVAGNTFGAMSWHVPPPPAPPKPAVKPGPPPPPAAPPMPFTFLGRYEDGDTRTIMLVKGDRIYTVSEGDVIDQTYRVDRLAGGQLELTYLPLDIKQTIGTGGS